MNYEIYKNVRNASWQCLIDCGICSLPTSLSAICRHFDIRIVKNSTLRQNQLRDNERGKTGLFQEQLTVIVMDTDPLDVQRYTIAHEIGHILIGTDSSEYEAERFAIGILAPSCVLWALQMHKPEDIAKLCNISLMSAKIRAERMAVLYKREQEFFRKYGRSCFLQSPLEQKVFKQFEEFIKQNQQ